MTNIYKNEGNAVNAAQKLANQAGKAAYVTGSEHTMFRVSMTPGTFNCLRVIPE